MGEARRTESASRVEVVKPPKIEMPSAATPPTSEAPPAPAATPETPAGKDKEPVFMMSRLEQDLDLIAGAIKQRMAIRSREADVLVAEVQLRDATIATRDEEIVKLKAVIERQTALIKTLKGEGDPPPPPQAQN